MKINRNYLKKSIKNELKISDIDFDDVKDCRFFIEDDFWLDFKNGKTTLSFWFAPKEPLKADRTFEVHHSQAPYYHFGTMFYPEGSTEPKFYKFTMDTEGIPETYRSGSFFIRFNKVDLGKTFYLTKGKLEVDDNPSLYSPSKTELEPSKQAIYLAGGVFQEVYPVKA